MKTVKHLAVAAIALASASAAQADGFRCETVDGSLNVKVYNHTSPEAGTRNAAVMVLSDPSVAHGRKTIARFTDVNDTLSSSGALFTADVDLRFADSRRKGELILGTKLGQLDEVLVAIDFTYGALKAGEETDGAITLVKRDGTEIREDLVCVRYLKN